MDKVETEVVEIRFFHGVLRKQLFVKITSDEGSTGIGEGYRIGDVQV